MDISIFSQAIEELYTALGNSLFSANLFSVRNSYINNSLVSKYIHMTIELNDEPMDFVISYDRFYKVPVLHFRINGKVECIHEYAQLDIHPILQCPYAMLHPCETDAFMKTTHLQGFRYLVFWFNTQMNLLNTGIQIRI